MSQTPNPAAGLVLLCIDLQPVFLKAIADHTELERRCEFAIQAAVGLGVAVAFTEQVPHKLGGTSPLLRALAGSAPVFAKTSFSAFGEATLSDWIRELGVDHVLLCGIETSVCVYQTALDALNLQRHVTILSDCIGGRRTADAAVCQDALIRAGAHVLPSETIFYSMLGDVNHPFFKGYTQLVKTYST